MTVIFTLNMNFSADIIFYALADKNFQSQYCFFILADD